MGGVRTNEIFGAIEDVASAAPSASKKPMPKIRTPVCQFLPSCNFDMRRRVALWSCRFATLASTHDDTERDDKNSCQKQECGIPRIRKPEEGQDDDERAREDYEGIKRHESSI